MPPSPPPVRGWGASHEPHPLAQHSRLRAVFFWMVAMTIILTADELERVTAAYRAAREKKDVYIPETKDDEQAHAYSS